MPALSWALRPPEVFDARSTPTNVGAIPEYFRTRKGASRSIHPTHSVCAIVRRTRELLDDHGLDCTPCGPHSPFRKLAETTGKIVMLGCGLCPNTTMHALEEYVQPPCLFGKISLSTIIDQHGVTSRNEYRTHGFSANGYARKYDRVGRLDTGSFMRSGQVLQATAIVLNSPVLKSAVPATMKEDPFFFVEALPRKAAGGAVKATRFYKAEKARRR
jgi:aminoglycoside 3-N-acetyltransferase